MSDSESSASSVASLFGQTSTSRLNQYFVQTSNIHDILNMHNKYVSKKNGTRFHQIVTSDSESESEEDEDDTSLDYAQELLSETEESSTEYSDDETEYLSDEDEEDYSDDDSESDSENEYEQV